MARKDKSSKRKSRENDSAIANGVDSEAIPSKVIGDKDGVVVMEDLNEPTMGEKLVSLNLAEDGEATNHDFLDISRTKPPTVDSVYILLKQALRADDRALLIDCLRRQDEKIITNSLSLLNPSDVLTLLQSLLSIVGLRGAVLAYALPWLRSLLLLHAASIISQESSLVALNSLYQIIESRTSIFDQALQLSSSLDILYASTVDDGEENIDMVTPVIFEDNDDSDDEGSQDSMETESVLDGGEPQVYSDISDNEDTGATSD
ncbi:uncharacterized protein [Primulina huaijiensis]|uniref:uncharacterized protein n=1 Tax=Primulina huaijiensis TaxID=1492673 RepID=UPI003CC6F383